MRIQTLLMLALAAACGSDTDPFSPTVVPAGETDPSWAVTGKTCSPTSRAYSVPRARLDSAPPLTHGPIRTVDDDWSDLARDIPGGFAGIIVESNVPVVFLADTTEKQGAFAALQARNTFGFNFSTARARAARWNFTQLAEWFRYFQVTPVMNLWISADIDEAQNRIEFGVRDSAGLSTLNSALSRLDVPCYLVATRVANIVVR
jgi:hypothetical protein